MKSSLECRVRTYHGWKTSEQLVQKKREAYEAAKSNPAKVDRMVAMEADIFDVSPDMLFLNIVANRPRCSRRNKRQQRRRRSSRKCP